LVAVWAALFLLVSMACSGGGGDGDTTNPTTYSITGQITSNSTGLAGVTVLLSGASTAETTTEQIPAAITVLLVIQMVTIP